MLVRSNAIALERFYLLASALTNPPGRDMMSAAHGSHTDGEVESMWKMRPRPLLESGL